MVKQQVTRMYNFSDAKLGILVKEKVAIANQDIFQEDRVEMGNSLYETLVKYTNTGQSIWVATDVAKYNDYVIYNTPSGEEEVPEI